MKQLVFALLILLLAPSLCLAQAAKKTPVAVSHEGHDQVGQSFAFALKEAIRGSQSFLLVDHEAVPKTARIVVYLISIEARAGDSGVSSAITIVYDNPQTFGSGIYITSSIHVCGRDRTESCAKRTLPKIDQAVEDLRKDWPSLWKTL
jgi:hypothetical protein